MKIIIKRNYDKSCCIKDNLTVHQNQKKRESVIFVKPIITYCHMLIITIPGKYIFVCQ